MQVRKDAGQKGGRSGRMQVRNEAVHVGCRSGRRKVRKEAGQENIFSRVSPPELVDG